MPRFEAAAPAAGVRLPGAYGVLRARERARNERAERLAADMQAKYGCHARRDRRLGDALDAGAVVVVVQRSLLELALWERDRPLRRVRLPFHSTVQLVAVSANDRIEPANDPD
jgi:hypothetical protein